MSENKSTSISIIIATYNSFKTLEKTINSIINQSFFNFELIIIDGNSSDDTVELIKKYSKHIVYWVSEPDNGIYDAWNKGIQIAKGNWISFIGSDDFLYDTNVLANINNYLQKADELNIKYVYGKIIKEDPANVKAIQYFGKPWQNYQSKILSHMCIGHWASFHKASLFEQYGLFNSDFKISGDYEFLLRIFKQKKNIGFFAESVTVAIVSEGGVSGNMNQLLQMANEQKSARIKNGLSDYSLKLEIWIFQIKMLNFIETIVGKHTTLKIFHFYKSIKKLFLTKF